MTSKRAVVVGSMLLAGLVVACSAPEPPPAPGDGALGSAEQAYCGGLYVTHLVRRAGTVFYVSPETLATATDGWGPQTLSLSDSYTVAPQITYQNSPSLSKAKNNITKTVQQAVGFSLTASVSLTATTLVLVPTDAYYRLEAYPEYQVIDWELHADACNFLADTVVTRGSVFRPVGIHFRVLVYVGGEWNALGPPSPAELLLSPPWAPTNVQNADAGAGTGGAGPGSPGGAGAANAQGGGGGQADGGTPGDGGGP